MGGPILGSEIRLDLDDAADAPPRRIVTDEAGADEGTPGRERLTRQQGPVDDAQRNG